MNEHVQQRQAGNSSVACPHCHSNSIRRSRRKRLSDWLMVCRLATPYRCRSCGYRFHWSQLSRRRH